MDEEGWVGRFPKDSIERSQPLSDGACEAKARCRMNRDDRSYNMCEL